MKIPYQFQSYGEFTSMVFGQNFGHLATVESDGGGPVNLFTAPHSHVLVVA
jgi:hypothetical protein